MRQPKPLRGVPQVPSVVNMPVKDRPGQGRAFTLPHQGLLVRRLVIGVRRPPHPYVVQAPHCGGRSGEAVAVQPVLTAFPPQHRLPQHAQPDPVPVDQQRQRYPLSSAGPALVSRHTPGSFHAPKRRQVRQPQQGVQMRPARPHQHLPRRECPVNRRLAHHLGCHRLGQLVPSAGQHRRQQRQVRGRRRLCIRLHRGPSSSR